MYRQLAQLLGNMAYREAGRLFKVPLKELTWHFVSKHVTDVLVADEGEIVDAMKLIWKRMKIVMEPSSAVPLATILKNPETFAGKRVGIIITGGNVDLDRLPWM